MNTQILLIEQIRRDSGAQFREAVDKKHVRDLADSLNRGDRLRPIVVFFDGALYWLGGGFHRIEAHLSLGRTKIEAEVREGGQLDARRYGRGDNGTPLLPRTVKTKRAQVEDALRDPEWGNWSDNAIAEYCKVSQPFVSQMRRELGLLTSNVISEKRTYTTKHGTVATMKTGNIGRTLREAGQGGAVQSEKFDPNTSGSLIAEVRSNPKMRRFQESLYFLVEAEEHRRFILMLCDMGLEDAEEWDIGFETALNAAEAGDDFLVSMLQAEGRMEALHAQLQRERGIKVDGLFFRARALVLEGLGVPPEFTDAEYYYDQYAEMVKTGSDEECRRYIAWVRASVERADWKEWEEK